MVLWTILGALWAMLPAYIANMGATVGTGGSPIDGGRTWRDGRRILGDGKTWRGLFFGTLFGTLGAGVLHPLQPVIGWPVTDFGPMPLALVHGCALGFGALLGDAVKSFIKRRMNQPQGARWLGPDQLDFIAGGVLLTALVAWILTPLGSWAWFTTAFTPAALLVILILTPGLHLIVNRIGYRIGAKKVPW